jgi:hypothetical protein
MQAKTGWGNFDGFQLGRLGILQTLHNTGRNHHVDLCAETNYDPARAAIIMCSDRPWNAPTLSPGALIGQVEFVMSGHESSPKLDNCATFIAGAALMRAMSRRLNQ